MNCNPINSRKLSRRERLGQFFREMITGRGHLFWHTGSLEHCHWEQTMPYCELIRGNQTVELQLWTESTTYRSMIVRYNSDDDCGALLPPLLLFLSLMMMMLMMVVSSAVVVGHLFFSMDRILEIEIKCSPFIRFVRGPSEKRVITLDLHC